MAKTNLQIALERIIGTPTLIKFQWQMIDYYLELRNLTQEALAKQMNIPKSTFSHKRSQALMPHEIEKIIKILNVENLDANRLRSKCWSTMAGSSLDDSTYWEFNRLYTDDAESTIRDLIWTVQGLERKLNFKKTHEDCLFDQLAESMLRGKTPKP